MEADAPMPPAPMYLPLTLSAARREREWTMLPPLPLLLPLLRAPMPTPPTRTPRCTTSTATVSAVPHST